MRKRTLSLSEKIFRITQEVATIERKGVGYPLDTNEPAYSYVKIEDILAVVNPLLKKYHLLLTGQVAKDPMTHVGKGFATTEVLMDWTVETIDRMQDPIRGSVPMESRVWRIPGSASDAEGKGIYKAMTGSRKYACTFIFNLKFGDEPEESHAKGSQDRPTGNADASVS